MIEAEFEELPTNIMLTIASYLTSRGKGIQLFFASKYFPYKLIMLAVSSLLQRPVAMVLQPCSMTQKDQEAFPSGSQGKCLQPHYQTLAIVGRLFRNTLLVFMKSETPQFSSLV